MLLALIAFYSIKAVTALQRSSNNWTTCEAFVNNTEFNPESVLDVDWRIFYFWNPEMETTYNIRFSRPTKGLVDRFRVELDKEMTPPVNWTNAELFMESTIDFSALYVKTDVSGIYRLIPTAAFDYSSVPLLIFALKVVKPGYLGIANCKYRLCYGLAPFDKMPEQHDLEDAAKSLGFFSEYNRSIVSTERPGSSTILPEDMQDDTYDPDPDMEMDPNRLEIF